jgi:dihydrofolate synthase/folylpolyglutamate synthase
LKSSLPGEHQIKNAALAVKTALLLRELGYRISRTDIRRGLQNTEWDGRFQIIKRKGCPSMILDVAHNPAGVKAMVDCFRKVFRGKKAGIILGLVSNKDLKRSVALIPKIADKIVVVRLNTYRSAEPEDIARHLRGKGVKVSIAGSLRKASRRMIESSTPDDIIIICGSHYGVGEFLAHRKEIYGG